MAQPRLGAPRRRACGVERAARRASGGGHAHHHHHHARAPEPPRTSSPSAISGGLLPCPTALVVLLAAISLHRVGYGLVLIVAFSLGLAGAMTAVGLAAVSAQALSPQEELRRADRARSARRERRVILVLGLAMTTRALPGGAVMLARRLDRWPSPTGRSLWLVLLVAVLLGLRHATDPDHLAAVTTLVAGGKTRVARQRGGARLAWGAGHATTLFVFGLPILLLNRYLPAPVEQGAETADRPRDRLPRRAPDRALESRGFSPARRRDPRARARANASRRLRDRARARHGGKRGRRRTACSPRSSSTALAVVALVLLAVFTAVSMCLLSTGFGSDPCVAAPFARAFGAVAPASGPSASLSGSGTRSARMEPVPYVF